MLQSALDHYVAQQRITAAGLKELRRRRLGSLEALVQAMSGYQMVAAIETSRAFGAMLTEQNFTADVEAAPVAAGLVGAASDGRDMVGLLDYARQPDVHAETFDLIVTTQLQDVARQMAAICLGVRPNVEGYVRVLNPPSCSRCAVLAGKFYRRNEGFSRHPRCDCRHVPTSKGNAGDLTSDPREYFNSLPTAASLDKTYPELTGAARREVGLYSQEDIFTKAGASVIRSGADIGQVVNARAGMSTAQQALRGPGDRWTASGGLIRVETFGQQIFTTTEGMTKRGNAFKARGRGYVRLMPESILEIADSPADVLRLLKAHGYIR